MPKPTQNGIEHKFIDLKELKVSDDSPGTIEGYRSVFSEIDEGGDLVVKGAFADCIAEYLHSGFTAHSHDWSFSEAVGFPIAAIEDDYGWKVTSQFHGTPDAQNIRQKAKERMDAGKQVGFSFGYKADEYQFVEQKDFKSQLPQFIKPERLEENLRKAQKFSRIRILKKVSAIEDSLVTAGMNKLAAATAVKSQGGETPEPTVMTKEELEALRKAVGASDLPLAPLDHIWDSATSEKAVRDFCQAANAPNADYAKSFLYVSEDGGDRFGDYALAFTAIIDGKTLAVPKRIIAVAERLEAMEISDEAKTAIRTKIDGYFAKMRTQFKDESLITPWAAKATATSCACCSSSTTDCANCSTMGKAATGDCSCHADCSGCVTAGCGGLASAGKAAVETIETLSEKVKQLTAQIEGTVEGKAGARNSASDKKKLATIHDAAASMEPSVCSGAKGIVVSAQVKGMYDDVLAEMVKPSLWDVYYAYLEVMDLIEDLPGTVGDSPVDKLALIDEALAALLPRMREASISKLEEPEVEYIYWAAPPADFKELSSEVLGTKTFDAHQLAVGTAVREVAQTAGVVREAVEVLTKRANEKQEFRTGEGRAISPRFRARKADMDRELAHAQEQITAASEKSQSLTLVEPEDLSAQAAEQRLRFEKLRQNAAAN